jgi:probable F420-dependent oxidoreductase
MSISAAVGIPNRGTGRLKLKIGVLFPQTEVGNDPTALRQVVAAAEALGFDYISLFDHVLGVSPDRPGGWDRPYTHRDAFHEVFVVLGFMAAVTTKIELTTEVLVLPQRPAALVAKQAAEVAVLSRGRLRLGVGAGWNDVEFVGMGASFEDRGVRMAEQIEVLRALWRDEIVHFNGRWHDLDGVGIQPRPPGGSIPLWAGGRAPVALRRAARSADGWMSNLAPGQELDAALAVLRAALAECGRDPSTFGLAGRVALRRGTEKADLAARQWQQQGASHLAIDASGMAFRGVAQMEAAAAFRDQLGSPNG